jgi:hypothetical protein
MESCSVFQIFPCSNVVSCERCCWAAAAAAAAAVVVVVVVVQVLKYACLQRTAFYKDPMLREPRHEA